MAGSSVAGGREEKAVKMLLAVQAGLSCMRLRLKAGLKKK